MSPNAEDAVSGPKCALSKEGQINVDMAVVGRLEASANHAKPTDGSTGCGGATDLVSGITVGAFQMYTGTAVSAGAGVGIGDIGAGGEVARSTEVLRRDGEFALEAFFEQPNKLKRRDPELHSMLREYFNQDPAAPFSGPA